MTHRAGADAQPNEISELVYHKQAAELAFARNDRLQPNMGAGRSRDRSNGNVICKPLTVTILWEMSRGRAADPKCCRAIALALHDHQSARSPGGCPM